MEHRPEPQAKRYRVSEPKTVHNFPLHYRTDKSESALDLPLITDPASEPDLDFIRAGAIIGHPHYHTAIQKLIRLTIDRQHSLLKQAKNQKSLLPSKSPLHGVFRRLYIFVFLYWLMHLIFAHEYITTITLALGLIWFVNAWWNEYQYFINALVLQPQLTNDDILHIQESPDLSKIGSAIQAIHAVFTPDPNPISALGLVSDIQPDKLTVCFFSSIILSTGQVSIKCEETVVPLQAGCALYDASWLHSVPNNTPTECPTIILNSLSSNPSLLTGFSKDFLSKMHTHGIIKPI
jgi:hypothetical protein